jgi:hypothetical protein
MGLKEEEVLEKQFKNSQDAFANRQYTIYQYITKKKSLESLKVLRTFGERL